MIFNIVSGFLCKVGGLKNVYHFELKGWEKMRVRPDIPYTTKSNGLLAEPCVSILYKICSAASISQVGFVEQQALSHWSLKTYYVPSDPLFSAQWQLVKMFSLRSLL